LNSKQDIIASSILPQGYDITNFANSGVNLVFWVSNSSNYANMPVPNEYGWLTVKSPLRGGEMIEFVTTNNKEYRIMYVNSSWSPWREI
jgi:hypothetical protein